MNNVYEVSKVLSSFSNTITVKRSEKEHGKAGGAIAAFIVFFLVFKFFVRIGIHSPQ